MLIHCGSGAVDGGAAAQIGHSSTRAVSKQQLSARCVRRAAALGCQMESRYPTRGCGQRLCA